MNGGNFFCFYSILQTYYYFDVSKSNLWQALTGHEEMMEWFYDCIPNFLPEVGFETSFLIKNEERLFTHNWLVTHIEHEKLIAYQWTFDEYVGKSESVFNISESLRKYKR